MRVKDLISVLENLNQEEEIYFLPSNSSYPEDFTPYVRENVNIHAFFGDDFKGTVIGSGMQVGGI